MATDFMVKSAKYAYSIHRLGIPKQIAMYRNSDFKRFNGDDLATSCEKFGELWGNSGFQEAVRRSPLVDQQFSYVCLATPLLDAAAISSLVSFVERSVLSFVSPHR